MAASNALKYDWWALVTEPAGTPMLSAKGAITAILDVHPSILPNIGALSSRTDCSERLNGLEPWGLVTLPSSVGVRAGSLKGSIADEQPLAFRPIPDNMQTHILAALLDKRAVAIPRQMRFVLLFQ